MGDGKKRKGEHSPDNSVRKKERTPDDDSQIETHGRDVELMDMGNPCNSMSPNDSEGKLSDMLTQVIDLTMGLKEKNLDENTENRILKVLSHLTELTNKNTQNKGNMTTKQKIKKKPTVTNITESMLTPGEKDLSLIHI